MNYLKNNFNIKIALFSMALIIGVCLFFLNRVLISNIREETTLRAKESAEVLSEMLNDSSDKGILLKHYGKFIESLNFPIIISNTYGQCVTHKINIDKYKNLEKPNPFIDCEDLNDIINDMDEKNTPIPITYDGNEIQTLHFGDPLILDEIINLSFITIGFFILFILIFLLGFYFMKTNEKDLIYVGMSKEAAHQLGTPLGSIVGWIELLKDEKHTNKDILLSLKKDVSRISEVTDRFSKIGSKIKLQEVELITLLKELKKYFDKRISKKYKISLKIHKNKKAMILGDKTLLFWAFENIIKNAIDAIETKKGEIIIDINKVEEKIMINFEDNGKGINRRNKRDIFKPGYSTKTRGWGLGLSLTKRIIENTHEGELSLQSSKPNKTVFRVIL